MVDAKEESGVAETMNFVEDKVNELPATKPAPAATPPRLFGRKRSIHELFGSGTLADVLLWRKKHWSAAVLAGSTVIYILFERAGFTLLSVVSNTLLFFFVILFLWSNVSSLFNRPPPPVPSMQVSEATVQKVAATICCEINHILAILRDVSLGKDLKMFLKVEITLYLLSIIGGWFYFLTLVYIGILGALTLPVFYDKYEDEIEKHTHKAVHETNQLYRKVKEFVLSKIPRARSKEKKFQ